MAGHQGVYPVRYGIEILMNNRRGRVETCPCKAEEFMAVITLRECARNERYESMG
jgi:hypothetical protein